MEELKKEVPMRQWKRGIIGQCADIPMDEWKNGRKKCQCSMEERVMQQLGDGLDGVDDRGNDLSIGTLADGPICQLTNII